MFWNVYWLDYVRIWFVVNSKDNHESVLAISSKRKKTLGYGLMDLTYGSHHVGQYWPMLTMSSSYVIFASQIVSALDLGRILASAQVTL